MMKLFDTPIAGVKILYPEVFGDNRGSFMELWNNQVLKKAGISDIFIQDNISTSVKGVLRGVHTQKKFPQAKIVTCLKGEIFDVAVDCRKDSPTLGKWYGEILSATNHKQIYLPAGVAHGFLVQEDAIVHMKVTTYYVPDDEIGFRWDDESVGIVWPTSKCKNMIFADKDLKWNGFAEMIAQLNK